jgi:hypothetical protein
VDCTGGGGKADDEGVPAKPPVESGGELIRRLSAPGRTCRPWLRRGAPSMVPVTRGAPMPLGPPLPGSCVDGAVEPRGTKTAVL